MKNERRAYTARRGNFDRRSFTADPLLVDVPLLERDEGDEDNEDAEVADDVVLGDGDTEQLEEAEDE